MGHPPWEYYRQKNTSEGSATRRRRISDAMLYPIMQPKKKSCYRYECYREAWGMLTKSRQELAQYGSK